MKSFSRVLLTSGAQAPHFLKKINRQIRWFSVSRVHQQPLLDKTPAGSDPQASSSGAVTNFKLNPWFVTGFTDGEGSFSVIVAKSNSFKVQWQARLFFQISLHVKDRILLEDIKNYFGVGEIHTKTTDSIIYSVKSIKDLTVIINHFDKYPLITQKWADYQIWKQAFLAIKNKQHLSLEGLKQIVALKAAMNWGLSEQLKTAFTGLVPVQKPLVKDQVVQDPNWLAGFVSGEGCFYVEIYKSKARKLGFGVKLVFKLTQHSKDEELMKSLKYYLDCGNISKYKEACDYKVIKLSDIQEKILPFFKNYPILGVKSQDFEDFYLVSEVLKEKKLNTESLERIQKIKGGMNKLRI